MRPSLANQSKGKYEVLVLIYFSLVSLIFSIGFSVTKQSVDQNKARSKLSFLLYVCKEKAIQELHEADICFLS